MAMTPRDQCESCLLEGQGRETSISEPGKEEGLSQEPGSGAGRGKKVGETKGIGQNRTREEDVSRRRVSKCNRVGRAQDGVRQPRLCVIQRVGWP